MHKLALYLLATIILLSAIPFGSFNAKASSPFTTTTTYDLNELFEDMLDSMSDEELEELFYEFLLTLPPERIPDDMSATEEEALFHVLVNEFRQSLFEIFVDIFFEDVSFVNVTQPNVTQPQVADTTAINNAVNFLNFVNTFTAQLVSGYANDIDRLRVIYDFLSQNFEYAGGRDGRAIDGSRRPQNVPPLTPEFVFAATSMGLTADQAFNIYFANNLLATGEGVCDDFSALFAIMATSLGFEARLPGGSYINRDGTEMPHLWVELLINGRWYYFDPQIEASNLTRRNAGINDLPRHWFMQYQNLPLTIERYNRRSTTDFSSAINTLLGTQTNQTRPAPVTTQPSGALRFVIGQTDYTNAGQVQQSEAAPFIQDGRTMVPLRIIGEALGATGLDMTNQVVSFVINGQTVSMTIGESLPGDMGTPVIVNGRTFVPLAYVAYIMDVQVRWDSTARAAYVYTA